MRPTTLFFNALAIQLQQWVGEYIPTGFAVEPIKSYMHSPYFLAEDARLLFEANACDVIRDGIDILVGSRPNFDSIHHKCVQIAIKEFFDSDTFRKFLKRNKI